MKRLALIIIILSNFEMVTGQIETICWQKCLGVLGGSNLTFTVGKTDIGYLFGIGISEDSPEISNYHGGGDAWIVHTDYYGNILWEKCFGGSDGDSPRKIIKITDSTYYLLNTSRSHDGDVQNGRAGDFWVVKINASGDIIWECSYGGSIIGEEVRDAILMPDNGLLLMGRISSTGGDVTTHYGNMDIWLCRIDKAGGIIWEKTFGNHGRENAIKIKFTSRNSIMMIGCHDESGGMIFCPEPDDNWANVWIIEMDINGNLLNQWCFGGSYWDQGWDIIEIEEGFVFVASTNSDDGDVSGFHGPAGYNEAADIWAVKIDTSGNIVWQRCLGGYSNDYPVYVTQTADSGFIIIGDTYSLDGDVSGNHSLYDNYSDIWVVKLSNTGELEWEHCFGGLGRERFWYQHGVLQLDDYNYIIGAIANYLDQDVECDLFPNNFIDYNAWLLEIKDCAYYAPAIPVFSSGPDTVCTSVNPASTYSLDSVAWAWAYEWAIEPQEAGNMASDSLSATITWNTSFEGTIAIKARSYNDCGFSAWSEPHLTFVYSGMGIGDKETGGQGEEGKRGVLEVWPNPASGVLSVKCLSTFTDVSVDKDLVIYDVFGREVAEIIIPDRQDQIQINVESYPPGVYIVILRKGYVLVESSKFVVVK